MPSARHIVSYWGNRYLDHFARDLEEIVEHGFNNVVHCVTEMDVEYCMDRMAEMFTMTKDAGLECWADPWGVGGVFGGEGHTAFLGRNIHTLQRSSDGKVMPHACLRHPDFIEYVESWVRAVADAGAERILWDEPHFGQTGTDAWACACERCVALFDGEPAATVNDEILDFQIAGATAFLDHVSRYSAERGMRNSVCLYPFDAEMTRKLGLPSVEEAAALEAIDDVGVDPYPAWIPSRPLEEFDPDLEYGGWAKRLADLSVNAGVSVHLWIQGFQIPEGAEDIVTRCAESSRNNGVTDLGFWSYRAAEATSWIKPGSAAAVWETARRTFG